MTNISILQGDITLATVDAIVNAANTAMLGGGGVDGAIHLAAGPTLLDECAQAEVNDGIRCPIGQSRITGAGDLNAKFVIHTVGPRYAIDPDPGELLASAYRCSLHLALENQCTSIAFPAISCGVYGYPYEKAAPIALAQCSLPQFANLDIRFYLFGQGIYTAWRRALNDLRSKQEPKAQNACGKPRGALDNDAPGRERISPRLLRYLRD